MKKAESIWFDGDSWESLSKEVKLAWVKGFVEAIYQASMEIYEYLLGFGRAVKRRYEGAEKWVDKTVEDMNSMFDLGTLLPGGSTSKGVAKVDVKLAEGYEYYDEKPGEKKNSWLEEEVTDERTVAELDEFYKDGRNKRIPVREAIYIVRLIAVGTPQKYIEPITKLRRMSLKERIEGKEALLIESQEYKNAIKMCGKDLPLSVSKASFESIAMTEQ